MRHPLLVSCALLAGLLLADTARADLIDPSEAACSKAGEACDVGGKAGVCTAQTCSKLDYSNPGPDGTPGTREYACVRCEPGAAPAEDTKDAAPAEDTKDAAPAEGAAPADAKVTSKPDDKPAAEAVKPEAKSGCSVGPAGTSIASFAAGLFVLGFVTRRRRG